MQQHICFHFNSFMVMMNTYEKVASFCQFFSQYLYLVQSRQYAEILKLFLCFQWSFRAQEPLLTLRRTLFTLAQQTTGHDFDHEIGHWWLWSAKIARK